MIKKIIAAAFMLILFASLSKGIIVNAYSNENVIEDNVQYAILYINDFVSISSRP